MFMAIVDGGGMRNTSFAQSKRLASYPLRRVVGPFPLVEAPVLEPIAMSAGFWPISPACNADAGLFQ